jgi:tRNA U38,U39,U40 pseudouridine synthase TruA
MPCLNRKAGAIDPEWETNPQRAFFQRASRTDKGVSAAKMIVSLKLLDDPDIIRKVQKSSVLFALLICYV